MKKFIIILLCMVAFSSCDTDDSMLQSVTQQGDYSCDCTSVVYTYNVGTDILADGVTQPIVTNYSLADCNLDGTEEIVSDSSYRRETTWTCNQ